MSDRKELNPNELDRVSGGCYVNVTMTIGDIIATDRSLSRMLANAGITTAGNKSVLGMTLSEAAAARGVDAYALEDRMNEYLSSK